MKSIEEMTLNEIRNELVKLRESKSIPDTTIIAPFYFEEEFGVYKINFGLSFSLPFTKDNVYPERDVVKLINTMVSNNKKSFSKIAEEFMINHGYDKTKIKIRREEWGEEYEINL